MARKNLLSLLLILALLLPCLPAPALAASGYTLTGRGADDIVSVARSRLGKTGRDLGYTYEWCACFITWAGRTAGQDFPEEDLYTPLDVARFFAEGDRGNVYCFRKATYSSLVQGGLTNEAAVLTNRASVAPQKGDLVCYLWAKDIEEGYNWSHIGIVAQDYDGYGVLTTIEGNTGPGDDPRSRGVFLQSRAYDETVVAVIRPHYASPGREVKHYLEQYGGGYVLADMDTVSPAGEEFTIEDAIRAVRTYDTHAQPDLGVLLNSIRREGPLEIYYPRLYTLAVIPGEGVSQASGSGRYTAGTEVPLSVQAAANSRLDWTDTTVRQKNGAWTLVMPARDVLLGVSAQKIDCVEPFLDVESGAWYAKYVAAVHERGLMNGTAADAFSPERGLTLAETVALAARLHSAAAGDGADFTPLEGEPWYAPCAVYARENGLLPEEVPDLQTAATRSDFARILGRALPLEALEPLWETPSFADLEGEVLPEEIALLCRAGVLSGRTMDGALYFRPEQPITRAEAAAVLARMADPALRLKPEE